MKIINIDDFKYGKRVRRFKDAPNPFYNATTIIDITPAQIKCYALLLHPKCWTIDRTMPLRF